MEQDSFVDALNKVLDAGDDFLLDLTLSSLNTQAHYYEKYCEKINFKSAALEHIKQLPSGADNQCQIIDSALKGLEADLAAAKQTCSKEALADMQDFVEQITERLEKIKDFYKKKSNQLKPQK